jgi:hypothetical protein
MVMIANNNFRCRKVVDVGNPFGRGLAVSTRVRACSAPLRKKVGSGSRKAMTSPVQIVSSIDAKVSIITVSVRGDRFAHGKPLGSP